MAEYIERETAKSVIRKAEGDFADKVSNNWLRPKFAEAIAKQLDKIPAADVVEVVRCKDCIHYEMGACLKIYSDGAVSTYAWQERKPDDFCSYGERRNDAAD